MRAAMRVANGPRLLVTCIVTNLIVCGEAYAALEHHGPIAGLWWAVVTGSTVGYGDQYPTSTAGRFVGMVLIVTSILFVAIATAQLSAKLIVDSNAWTDDEQEETKRQLREMHAILTRLDSEWPTTSKTSARTSGPSTASSGTRRTRSRSTTSRATASGISGWWTRRRRGWPRTSRASR